MMKIYNKDEFKDAAKKDKLTLSDENKNITKSALPETGARLFTGRAPVSNGRGKAGLKF